MDHPNDLARSSAPWRVRRPHDDADGYSGSDGLSFTPPGVIPAWVRGAPTGTREWTPDDLAQAA